MGNWNLPTVDSDYLLTVGYFQDRDTDAATMAQTPTNPPSGYIRYNRSLSKLQEWDGAAWNDIVFGLAAGGTSAISAPLARTALGLGSLATQDNNAVNITGGSISGVTLDAGLITSGEVPLSRGGTGASLALGAANSFLQSSGASVIFGVNGSLLTFLNATQLTSGLVPVARLSGITVTQLLSANISQFTNDSGYITVTGPFSATYLTGTIAEARLPTVLVGSYAIATLACDSFGTITAASLNGSTTIAGTFNLNVTTSSTSTAGGLGLVSITEFATINVNGTPRKIALYGV